jgi:hypothetical protein
MKASKVQRKTQRKLRKHRRALSIVPPVTGAAFVKPDAQEIPLVPSRAGGNRQGIFYPELVLGPRALRPKHAHELRQFLVEVIRQRGQALHLANLWNTLYFNYDLDHWGYHADRIEQRRIPLRGSDRRDLALPVGGFMRVHTETACGDLLAEVIYKEGADERVDATWLDRALSGAPASEEEPSGAERLLVRRERYVIDLDAFGAKGLRDAQLARLRARGLWLDEHGHLLTHSHYRPQSADLDPLDHYADYLLHEHREGLLAFCFSASVTDSELREALLRSFETVRELLLQAPELRSWHDEYFFLELGYRERLNCDGPLGANDLQSVYGGLRRLPNGEQRGYSAIGPRLIDLLGGDDIDQRSRTTVEGCAYATAICHANSYIAARLSEDQADGVSTEGSHLRLDDAREGGGIWRVERVEEPERYSLRSVPPLLELGLGYAESHPGEQAAAQEEAEQPIAATQTGFCVPLTITDRSLRRLRLPARAAAALVDGPVEVGVRHGDERWRAPVERDGTHLFGVEYPWEFYPGLVLHGNVENGGSVVRVHSERATPTIVARDGRQLDYDTNLAIYERDNGQQLPERDRQSAPTLRALIIRAFRSAGDARADDGRALTLSELTTLILGPGWRAVESRPIVLALATMNLERDGAWYIWRPAQARSRRTVDRHLLDLYGEHSRLEHVVRRHSTPMHLRRFSEYSGRSPSAEKRASYAEARALYGMHGVLPAELPPECTWVKPSSWGGSAPVATPAVGAALDPA